MALFNQIQALSPPDNLVGGGMIPDQTGSLSTGLPPGKGGNFNLKKEANHEL